ncbi:ABC transporter substrate-binding protein [Clostridium chauvoei]|uniref:Spermidine/putrescine ABC transporter substrate-binding protein n=2 Tax=Clostridium chauvoei TaxID=46867 RepID=A0ABD4RF95_9CLOT|nr:spermidine/putrescine ABC transporter substrate-binding protein [Clostridium chauvoei]MBX7280030.1 spermidine/putrescine ABC transporter substrate-binding protein [Clostridium chauvoei]MBX7282311.1 spermidine/putrescine ABC transporter substrate-binding protein [Clostridium chauvoei]MBX7284921.1 spermidine/putrescine ABC transporter substrate-binding protein [Clostridium chauvoei]MBX7287313.1 spermidine/putrescine ABC transporter substrate-binding protein [Clostridium chauvoei]MBX7290119.1 
MKMHKKLMSLVTATILSSTLFIGCSNNSDSKKGVNGSINVFNCGDYINPDLIGKFEAETGIKVIYDTYDTNEIMYQKVKTSPGTYDLVFPSDYMVEKMIKEDMAEKIDYNNVPNYINIGNDYKNLSYDPTNEYSIPYMWGTIGIIYDADKVKGEITSWNDLWDSDYKDEIFMFDSIRDTLAIALIKLGYSQNSVDPYEIDKASEELIKQKPLVQSYVVDEVKDKMINGEAALATVWSGDAVYIQEEAPDLNLKYIVPKEGSNKWFDTMVIPKDAPNKSGAEAFINFLLDPENARDNVEYIGYATPNIAAYALLDEETQKDPTVYPPKEVLDKCEIFKDLGNKLKIYDDAWLKVKIE